MTTDDWTILKVLSWTAERFTRENLATPRLDAEILLAHALSVDRVRLYLDFDKPLEPGELSAYRGCVRRRLAREPVAYITGHREFWSLAVAVSPAVLIPRPDTELLVEQGLALARAMGDGPTVVDVGTGSGAIALALAKELPGARVVATEVDAAALEVAARNVDAHALRIALCSGDLLEALAPDLSPDLVVANLPYIASEELDGLEPEITRYEPRLALDGGPDGLDLIRRLIPQAAACLRPDGALALEVGWRQAAQVRQLLEHQGFSQLQVHQDLAGLDRVISARR
jgi:release factor glutamine methyltransferase